MKARLGLGLGAATCALALGVGPACGRPTEIVFEVTRDAPVGADVTLAVWFGDDPAPRVVTALDAARIGSLGTVTAVAADDAVGEVHARVVLARGRDPRTCAPGDLAGCTVALRAARFEPGRSRRVTLALPEACEGVDCGEGASCGPGGTCLDLSGTPVDGPVDAGPTTHAPDDAGSDADGPFVDDAAAADAYEAAVLADRPRHYWRLDEPPGSRLARDRMGRADGVFEGDVRLGVTGALAVSTRTGVALAAPGARIVVRDAEQLPGAFSVEAWMREDANDEARPPTIVERLADLDGAPFGYRLSRPPSAVRFDFFEGASVAVARGDRSRFAGYAHLAAVVDAQEVRVYLAGSLQRVVAREASAPTPRLPTELLLGASATGEAQLLGTLDEVAVYDYPLTAARVAEHARHGRGLAP